MSEAQRPPAGERETGRLLAFSDGVFAIAITLLVLGLVTPVDKHGLWHNLLQLWPGYLSYAVTFIIIGIIWAQHHTIYQLIERTDHVFILLNIVFLMWIAFLPFPAGVLAHYLTNPSEQQTATSFYVGTFLVGVVPFNLLWRYAAANNRLINPDADRKTVVKITRSYDAGPVLYLVDFVLSFVSVPASLALFMLLAIFYAVAPLPAVDRFLAREYASVSVEL